MIRVTVSPFLLIVLFFALLHGFFYEMLLIFLVVLIHELGHAYTAIAFGWRVDKIVLLPVGGAVELSEYGNKPLKEEALVILAGPLMNLLMMALAWLCMSFNLWKESFAWLFMEYNLVIFLFNLLPIWPLDGAKLFQLLTCRLIPYRKAIQVSLISSGICLLLYMVAISIFLSYVFYFWVVGVFLAISYWGELRQRHYQFTRFLLSRFHGNKQHQQYEPVSIMISPYCSVKDALGTMFRHHFHYFCLINANREVLHILHEGDLLEHFFKNKGNYAVQDILR